MWSEEYLFPFEKLEVWQLAKKLVIYIYDITKKFPKEERFILVSQINRAAISVVSNLAEGSSRFSFKEQSHFSQIAYSSLMELSCQLDIAKELGFIKEDEYENLRHDVVVLATKINALRRSQKERIK